METISVTMNLFVIIFLNFIKISLGHIVLNLINSDKFNIRLGSKI